MLKNVSVRYDYNKFRATLNRDYNCVNGVRFYSGDSWYTYTFYAYLTSRIKDSIKHKPPAICVIPGYRGRQFYVAIIGHILIRKHER